MRSSSMMGLALPYLAAAALASEPASTQRQPKKIGKPTKAEKKAAKRARTRGVALPQTTQEN